MTRLFRHHVSRSEDALTELQYETYLERYHNICHEITAIRTKTAISLGMVGVIFTIIVAISLNNSEILAKNHDFIIIFGGIFLVIFINYFQIYVRVHVMGMTEYPDKQTLTDLNSDDINESYHYSRKTCQKEIISRLKNISDELIMKYTFYKEISGVVDIMFLVLLGMGGIVLMYFLQGSSMKGSQDLILLLLSSLLLIGCVIITLVLFIIPIGTIMNWFMYGWRRYVIRGNIIYLGCILFMLVVCIIFLCRIYG